MTLRHFQVFVMVCDLGSVTRAAQMLHMTQPAVSRVIRELEDYYHFRLFERVKQRLVLTDGGKMVYHRATHLIHEFALLEKDMLAYNEQHTLAIGANYTMGERVLPMLGQRLSAEDPLLRIFIHVEPTQKLTQLLENNGLDIALTGNELQGVDFACRHLSFDRFVAVMPAGHPLTEKQEITLAELLHFPFFARQVGSSNRTIVDQAIRQAGLVLTPTVESTSVQFIIHAVMSGSGVSILPECLVQREVEEGCLAVRPIRDPGLIKDTFVVWRKDHYMTAAMRRTLEILREMKEQKLL